VRAEAERSARLGKPVNDLAPDWITGSEQVFDLLATGVPWKQHYRRLYDRNFLESAAQAGRLPSKPPAH
jgi:hypothetical protein